MFLTMFEKTKTSCSRCILVMFFKQLKKILKKVTFFLQMQITQLTFKIVNLIHGKAIQGYFFGQITRLLPLLCMEFPKPKTSLKTSCFFLNDAIFWRCFGKNIDVDVFDDVHQNSKHRANNATMLIAHPYWQVIQFDS